jgi:hypothetical protein
MFFALLCLLLWALFAFDVAFDNFGWLMLVATGWFAGFMDARLFAKRDQTKEGVVPPGDPTDTGSDETLFRS